MKTKIDMTGTWFVSYGIPDKLEGCNIFTINRNIDASEILANLTDTIVSSFHDDSKEIVRKYGPLIIRNMTRLSPLLKEGGAK